MGVLVVVGLLLATIAVCFALRQARAFFLPVVVAVLLSFLLRPIVRTLDRVGMPTVLGAGLVLIFFTGLAATGIYHLSGPAAEWIEKAPQSLRRAEYKLRGLKKPVEEVQQAAKELEQIANGQSEQQPQVQLEEAQVAQTLMNQARALLATIMVVLFLVYFLLASGDFFLRKLASNLPDFSSRKKAIAISLRTQRELSRYLFTMSMINVGLGSSIALGLWLVGMPNPILWGVMAAFLNFVPYLGPLVGIGVVALVALITFSDTTQILAGPAIYALLNSLEGGLVTPLIMGRRLQLNPVAIFLALIFWGWLWGIPGALLAVPLLAMFKIVCDNVDLLRPVGQFLGR